MPSSPPGVFREGWDAYFAGRKRDDNPYPHGDIWWAAWNVGYDDALRERSKETECRP